MIVSRVERGTITRVVQPIGLVLVLIAALGCGFESGRRGESRPTSEAPSQIGGRPTLVPFVAAPSSPVAGDQARPTDQRTQLSAVEVVQRVSPAVVTVVNERR